MPGIFFSPPGFCNLNLVASYLKLCRSLTLQKKITMVAKKSPDTFLRMFKFVGI